MKDSISADTRSVVEQTVHDVLRGYAVTACDVVAGKDAAGEDVIFVDLCYDLDDKPVASSLVGRLRSAVRRRLLDKDEHRFPHIRHYLQQGQKVTA